MFYPYSLLIIFKGLTTRSGSSTFSAAKTLDNKQLDERIECTTGAPWDASASPTEEIDREDLGLDDKVCGVNPLCVLSLFESITFSCSLVDVSSSPLHVLKTSLRSCVRDVASRGVCSFVNKTVMKTVMKTFGKTVMHTAMQTVMKNVMQSVSAGRLL
jgi:hypothetical protein